MGKMSRTKGAGFERTVAKLFSQYGYKEASRSAQHCGKTGQAADVKNVPGIHIEAKAQEKMHLYEWMQQAIRDSEASDDHQLPVVIHKQNYKDVLVSMRFSDWILLYQAWEQSNIR